MNERMTLMKECMNAWMNERTDKGINAWMNEWMTLLQEGVNEWNSWQKLTNEFNAMKGNEWMNEWMNGLN